MKRLGLVLLLLLTSNTFSETINGHTLPPEPDPKINNSTLLGIDSNNNGVRESFAGTVTLIDVIPPVLTLNGEANVTLEQNANYVELGASATDDKDGNISVEISGSVDTSREGSYELTYTATDSSGNSASVIRVVIVRVYSK